MSIFSGTGVALVTPFSDDDSIDFNGLKKLLDHVSQNGGDYLVVNGTTGESPTTSQDEKKQILDFVLKENKGKLPVVFGIGGNNTKEVLERIKNTNFEGISAILSVCPYYNKPSQEGIYQHYKKIAEASPVPVILYNVPGRTGINMTAETTIRLSNVKNVIGIKEANSDLKQAEEIANKSIKGFLLISGDDMTTASFGAIGGVGVISVLANAFPAHFKKSIQYTSEGKHTEAEAVIAKLGKINPLMYEEGNPVGIKEVLERKGICKSNVRLPLVKASQNLRDRILQAINEVN
ncbi:4-hydroxy-tetrahydrodipicolinate synthase [Sporocytophaga myxococcoides]|uniref:4-hydroxy-tetrahydrodipicolinate synthase n=1 Tax=Sporocytophaga myxococcoides TaxID=153721 RepID=UPI0003F54611|nr:4-hydroxy-tetrahydrodipicolinate synthase [Sporocytophaga myxococcoides]